MLEIKLSGGEKLIQAMRSRPSQILNVISRRLQAILFVMAGKVAAQKLSGQVLAVRKGWLRSSVHANQVQATPGQIFGTVGAANPPAGYGVFHEFGVAHGWTIEPTRAKALRFQIDGRWQMAARVFHGPLPARPFMSTTEAESKDWIRAELQAAIDREISKP
jgi:phage gpG-like protein